MKNTNAFLGLGAEKLLQEDLVGELFSSFFLLNGNRAQNI